MRVSSDFPNINSKDPEGLNELGQPYKVLLVDDSIFIQKQLSQILVSEQFEIIDTATDGVLALEKYKEHHPNVDIVTMDITMPNMDGLTCLTEILKFDKNAKVIVISALGKEDLVKRALVAGAKNYIVKPLDRKKVLERVKSALGK